MQANSFSLRVIQSAIICGCLLLQINSVYSATCTAGYLINPATNQPYENSICDQATQNNGNAANLQTPACGDNAKPTSPQGFSGVSDILIVGNNYVTGKTSRDGLQTLYATCACELGGPGAIMSNRKCSCNTNSDRVGNLCLTKCTGGKIRVANNTCQFTCDPADSALYDMTHANRKLDSGQYPQANGVKQTIVPSDTPTACEFACDIGYKMQTTNGKTSCELIQCPVGEYFCPATTVNGCVRTGTLCGSGGAGTAGNNCAAPATCDIDEGAGCKHCDGVVGDKAHCADGLVAQYQDDGAAAKTDRYKNSSCVPYVACEKGTRWCQASHSCITPGTDCGTNNTGDVCNKNSVCDPTEGCGCADCNGQTDHCATGLNCLYDKVIPKNSMCTDECNPDTQITVITPQSPFCIGYFIPGTAQSGSGASKILASPAGAGGTDMKLIGYPHLVGNCGFVSLLGQNLKNNVTISPGTNTPAKIPVDLNASTNQQLTAFVKGEKLYTSGTVTKPTTVDSSVFFGCPTVPPLTVGLPPIPTANKFCKQSGVPGTPVVCGCYPLTITTIPTIIKPEYKCLPKIKCEEGTYYCASSNKCEITGTDCTDHACYENGICDATEGCGCADCNSKQDHCATGLTCVTNTTNPDNSYCFNANCTQTEAPSEIQGDRDKPYIKCSGDGVAEHTHFMYRITRMSSTTEAPLVVGPFTIGTSVLHEPVLSISNYRVECLYGNSTLSPSATLPAAHICEKIMQVKAAPTTGGPIPGCQKIYAYKNNSPTPTTELNSSTSFNARFECESYTNMVTPPVLNPFQIQVNSVIVPLWTNPLSYYTNFLSASSATITSVSDKSVEQPIQGRVKAMCAVKVGGGYSTSKECSIQACSGEKCDPDTFDISPSIDNQCVNTSDALYDIGCKPSSLDIDTCVDKMKSQVSTNGSTNFPKTFTMEYKVGGVEQSPGATVTCNMVQPKPAASLYDVIKCTARLPTGHNVALFTSDFSSTNANSYQTINNVAKQDNTPPTLSLDLDTTLNLSNWQKTPITLRLKCVNNNPAVDDACACGDTIYNSSNSPQTGWTKPGGLFDMKSYSSFFQSSVLFPGASVYVTDTAKNQSPSLTIPTIGIDTVAPNVQPREDSIATSSLKTITLTATDNLSGIWLDQSSILTNIQGTRILYKVGNITQMSTTLPFDDGCGITGTPNYSTVTSSTNNAVSVTIPNIDTTSQIISYCVQDNAGNIKRGFYPKNPEIGCFSDSRYPVVNPQLDTYKTALITKLTNYNGSLSGDAKIAARSTTFGYEWTQNPTAASCMQTILTGNINTLVKNKFNASTDTTLDWSKPATIKASSNSPNTQGYYYFTKTSASNDFTHLTIGGVDFTTTTLPDPSQQRVVVVENRSVRIVGNIIASSATPLILIVRGGGDVYIDTSVTRIDAIIITDGSLKNIQIPTFGNPVYPDWTGNSVSDLDKRLVINGRLYSGNTRGGSLEIKASTGALDKADKGSAIFFDTVERKLEKPSGNPAKEDAELRYAKWQDLERFRMVPYDGGSCTLTVNYKQYTPTTLPPILQRPAGMSCSANF